jgi:hypothetical protein
MSTRKYIIPIIIISAFIGTSSSNFWSDQDTTTGLSEGGFYSPVFKPANQTPVEIIQSPFFRYVGEEASLGTGVNATAASAGSGIANVTTSNSTIYVISSKGNTSTAQMSLDFNGGVERNLRYAENSSTIKIGQDGKWVPVSLPWMVG